MDITEQVHAWQRQYSAAATARRRRTTRLRSLTLGLLIVGAVGSAVDQQVVRVVTASVLAVATVLAGSQVTGEAMRAWVGLRAVAERLKSELVVYQLRVPPYGDDDRDDRLLAAAMEVLAEHGDVAGAVDDGPPAGPPKVVDTIDAYLRDRVDGQIAYFRKAARERGRRAQQLRWSQVALSAAAAVVGTVAVALDGNDVSAFVGACTTAAGAVASHLAASRYQEEHDRFVITRRQLEGLRAGFTGDAGRMADPAEQQRFVRRVEDLLLDETRSWSGRHLS